MHRLRQLLQSKNLAGAVTLAGLLFLSACSGLWARESGPTSLMSALHSQFTNDIQPEIAAAPETMLGGLTPTQVGELSNGFAGALDSGDRTQVDFNTWATLRPIAEAGIDGKVPDSYGPAVAAGLKGFVADFERNLLKLLAR